MAAIPIHTQTFHDQHPELMKKEIRECTKEGHLAMGLLWVGELLEEHFQENAKNVFAHKPRSFRYLKKKKALATIGKVLLGGTVDLVFSGASMRAILRSKAARLVRATATRTTIDLIVPWYFKIRRRTGRGPDKARELKSLSSRHERLLAKAAAAGYSRKLRSIQARKTVKTT